MIDMLKALMDEVDPGCKNRRTVYSEEMEILGRNQREMPEIKNTIGRNEEASDGLTSRLFMAGKESL